MSRDATMRRQEKRSTPNRLLTMQLRYRPSRVGLPVPGDLRWHGQEILLAQSLIASGDARWLARQLAHLSPDARRLRGKGCALWEFGAPDQKTVSELLARWAIPEPPEPEKMSLAAITITLT
jgi:hypothetical protein